MKRRSVSSVIATATEGVFSTLTDMILSELFFLFLLPGATSPYDISRASDEARNLVDDHINYQTIKRTIYNLTRRGLVKRSAIHTRLELEITELGRKRIEAIVPMYHEKRPWDKHIYLVSYDVPVQANRKRTLLRENLKRIGCALLQESLWITPYTPQLLVKEFTNEYSIPGTILVSKLGKDGAIGDESFEDLIARVYRLDALADRYNEFIQKCEEKTISSPLAVSLSYLPILKSDPQLPFELLPKNFPAQRAWNLFQTTFKQS